MSPEDIRQVQYGRVTNLVQSLDMILKQLDQYSEDEILETLAKIEEAIELLPINESTKLALCDLLWNTDYGARESMNAVMHLLSVVKILIP